MTRAQALENRAFLKELRRTGNVRLACRELGLNYGTMQHRRRKHRGFGVRWDAALAFSQTSLAKSARRDRTRRVPDRVRDDERDPRLRGDDGKRSDPLHRKRSPSPGKPGEERSGFRTVGGEAVMVRLKDGTVQMRRAQPGKLTPEAEQAFLAALSATCNFALAAAAVGANFNAFNRRRKKDPAFAREVRLALQRGHEALEVALIESTLAASHEHDDWRHNEPPAMPPMSAAQALQLLYLHQKAALLVDEPTPMRRRRGESHEACCERLAQMAEARAERQRQEFEVAEAERWERGEPAWGIAGQMARERMGLVPRYARDDEEGPSTAFGGPPPLENEGRIWLPDLAQVTGWSKADPEKGGHGDAALFGGWRIEHMQARLAEWEQEYDELEKREQRVPRMRRL